MDSDLVEIGNLNNIKNDYSMQKKYVDVNEKMEKTDSESIKIINKNANINVDEPAELIEIDEIDFGDYMSNLIKKTSENMTLVKNIDMDNKKELSVNLLQNLDKSTTQILIPTKIKIGKKKI